MTCANENKLTRLDWLVLVWAVFIYIWFKICCAHGYGVSW